MLGGWCVAETPSTISSMLLPTVLLMLSAGLREAYPSVPFRYRPYSDGSPESVALKVLKGLDPSPTTLSTPLALELLNPLLQAHFQRRALRRPDSGHLKAKKQQNPPSYNWNSFGLRYGK
ncbi:kiss1 [Arapaima gigas]